MASLSDSEALGVIDLLNETIRSRRSTTDAAWEFFAAIVSADRPMFDEIVGAADRDEPPSRAVGDLTFGQRLMLTAVVASAVVSDA